MGDTLDDVHDLQADAGNGADISGTALEQAAAGFEAHVEIVDFKQWPHRLAGFGNVRQRR